MDGLGDLRRADDSEEDVDIVGMGVDGAACGCGARRISGATYACGASARIAIEAMEKMAEHTARAEIRTGIAGSLAPLLLHEDAKVRECVAEALGATGENGGVYASSVVLLLKDQEAAVRQAASLRDDARERTAIAWHACSAPLWKACGPIKRRRPSSGATHTCYMF